MIQNRGTIPSDFAPITHKSLSLFQFTAYKIKSVINKLDPSKPHGHDMITVCITKLCSINDQWWFLNLV